MDLFAELERQLLGNFPGFAVRETGGSSALNDIVNATRRRADGLDQGDQMLVDCLGELTLHCLEIVNDDKDADDPPATINDLNDTNVGRYFIAGTFATAADRLGIKYLLPWFNSACRDLVARAMEGGKDEISELAGAILTNVMRGKIATPVVKACDLPLTGLAMDAAAGLQKLVTVVGAERYNELLKTDGGDTLDEQKFDRHTCLRLTAVLERQDMLKALKEARRAVMAIQRYANGGDQELAYHYVHTLEKALGLREKPTEQANPAANDDGNPDWVKPIPNATPPSGQREPALAH
ncbi:MAG: hypothetical protein AAB416_03370 [Patescibacteria group bacterium]